MARVRRIAVVRPLLAVVLLTAVAAAQVPGYSREVRPILAEKCFRCHGPDGDARRAGLRLDLPGAGDLLGRERGDELLRRIAAGDPEVAMPPPESGKTLTTPERDTLERWIAGGGRYERHWAFVPPERPAVPEPPDGAANDHPIDAFVRARLAAVGLEPSPEADRATLVRRVWLDLVGLPPTPAEAAAFVDDPRPDAYERLVDALLASPHYGERQARRWLDLARYADSNGYEKDRERSIWPYRDWVIRALDADMPFDEFAVKQIAGDMLPDPTPDDWIATGFHRNTMLNEEGGIDPLEYRFHALTDRVATTGTAFLGLTLGCAQCHTHKFDPITHREYFGLLAYFDDADEPDYAIPDAAADERERDARRRAEAALEQLWDEWPGGAARRDEAFASWLAAQRKKAVAWTPAHVLRASANVPTLLVDDPGSGEVFATGDTTKHDVYRLELAGGQRPVTAIRLEALPDARLPAGGPGLTYYEGRKGDFFLGEFVVTAGSGDGAAPVAIARASASYWKNQFGNSPVDAGRAIDGDLQTGWSTHGRHGQREVAVFVPAEPIAAALPIAIELHFGRHFASSLGRFRVSFTDAAGGAEALALPFDADGALEASLRTEATATDPTSLRPAFLLSADEVKDRGN
ncbi:MAG: DUF1549 domain-containing protein, partial [Planctomycetes bacterium]|nr:DUF1549 domain-containing protein [Planctomycetota bacterium]